MPARTAPCLVGDDVPARHVQCGLPHYGSCYEGTCADKHPECEPECDPEDPECEPDVFAGGLVETVEEMLSADDIDELQAMAGRYPGLLRVNLERSALVITRQCDGMILAHLPAAEELLQGVAALQ